MKLALLRETVTLSDHRFSAATNNSTPMKLSVIIPTYNRAAYLAASVNSALAARPGEVEVIVVDDGSTDNTTEVVSTLEPAVRYLRQQNAGPAAARNLGFAASQGEFVAFLDSDDHWFPAGAAQLLDIMERHSDLPLVFGDAAMGTLADGTVSFVATFGGDRFAQLPRNAVEPGVDRLDRNAFFRLLTRRNSVFMGALLLRRQVVEDVGAFEPTLFGTEDWDFMMRLAARHEYAYYDGEPVAFYLQHPGGISQQTDRMEGEFAKALRHLVEDSHLDKSNRLWVRQQLIRQEFEYAYLAYDQGNLEAARERFAQCWKTRPSPTTLGYWAASHLPSTTLGMVRRWKRRLER